MGPETEKPVGQALVEQGMVIMRAENETQQAMAIQRPRSLQKVADSVIEELRVLPDFAAKAYYSIPYKDGGGNTVKVEGLSIKSAMAIARNWGNCANGARVVDDLDDRLIVEGVFLDYETNLRTLRQVSVSKMAWSKQMGRVVRLRDDRLNMAIQAGMSKAIRNAILASLPQSLTEAYFAKARSLVKNPPTKTGERAKTLTERLQAMFAAFEKAGVSGERLNAYFSAQGTESPEDILETGIGLWNAIKDGQTSVDEVFGHASEPRQPAQGEVKPEDLEGKKQTKRR